MTCIVAGKEKGYSWIAGDRKATWGDSYFSSSTKIFKNENFLYGYAGSYKYGTVLWDILASVPTDADISFLEMQKMLGELAKDYKISDNDTLEEVEILLVYQNEIFICTDNLHFIKIDGDYFSIGSGSEYATGAIWSARKLSKDLYGKELAIHALECSANHSVSVGGKFDFLSTEPKPPKSRKKIENLALLVQ